jgi:hypothetical protein
MYAGANNCKGASLANSGKSLFPGGDQGSPRAGPRLRHGQGAKERASTSQRLGVSFKERVAKRGMKSRCYMLASLLQAHTHFLGDLQNPRKTSSGEVGGKSALRGPSNVPLSTRHTVPFHRGGYMVKTHSAPSVPERPLPPNHG